MVVFRLSCLEEDHDRVWPAEPCPEIFVHEGHLPSCLVFVGLPCLSLRVLGILALGLLLLGFIMVIVGKCGIRFGGSLVLSSVCGSLEDHI